MSTHTVFQKSENIIMIIIINVNRFNGHDHVIPDYIPNGCRVQTIVMTVNVLFFHILLLSSSYC